MSRITSRAHVCGVRAKIGQAEQTSSVRIVYLLILVAHQSPAILLCAGRIAEFYNAKRYS